MSSVSFSYCKYTTFIFRLKINIIESLRYLVVRWNKTSGFRYQLLIRTDRNQSKRGNVLSSLSLCPLKSYLFLIAYAFYIFIFIMIYVGDTHITIFIKFYPSFIQQNLCLIFIQFTECIFCLASSFSKYSVIYRTHIGIECAYELSIEYIRH